MFPQFTWLGTTEKKNQPTELIPKEKIEAALSHTFFCSRDWQYRIYFEPFLRTPFLVPLMLDSQRLNTNKKPPFYYTKVSFLPPPHLLLLILPSDSLTGDDSLLVCDLLSHTSPHGGQSVSTLPSSSSSCSSTLLTSCPGLEEAPSAQRLSGKSSSHFAASFCRLRCCWRAASSSRQYTHPEELRCRCQS